MPRVLKTVLTAVAAYGLVVAVVLGLWAVYEPVRVAGGSMYPALVTGDIALVRRHALPRKGDIVLVRQAGHTPVLHRVLEVHGDGSLRLKGDANPVPDISDVSSSEVAGPVTRVVPVGAVLDRWRAR